MLSIGSASRSFNEVFGAREKRVAKGVDIEEMQNREKRHEREKRETTARELIMKKRGCKLEMGMLEGN